jgi:hypothetical protein
LLLTIDLILIYQRPKKLYKPMRIAVLRTINRGARKGEISRKVLKVKQIFKLEGKAAKGNLARVDVDLSEAVPLIIECIDASGAVYALKDKTGSIAKALAAGEKDVLSVDVALSKEYFGRPDAYKMLQLFPKDSPLN